jgi:hypothetical protein
MPAAKAPEFLHGITPNDFLTVAGDERSAGVSPVKCMLTLEERETIGRWHGNSLDRSGRSPFLDIACASSGTHLNLRICLAFQDVT